MILKKSEKSFVRVIVMTYDVVMCSFVSLHWYCNFASLRLTFSVRVTSVTKIKALAKNTGSESLPVFVASVLILVIVNEDPSFLDCTGTGSRISKC